jgi:hypothetical protein
MGNIISGSDFTGRLGPVSVYKMHGHDKLVIRTPGGASKSRIKNHRNFEATRNLNQEWKLVTGVAANIRMYLAGLCLLADYNVSGPLNALLKKIQIADTINEKGKRSILFSRYPDYISSFQFNRQTLFNSIVRLQPEVSIDKQTATVTVMVPALQPDIHFFPNPRYAYYRLIIDVAAASDQVWDKDSLSFKPSVSLLPKYKHFFTDWVPTSSTQPAATYAISPFYENFTTGPGMILIAGTGVEYGMPGPDGSIQPAPRAGAARILKCV